MRRFLYCLLGIIDGLLKLVIPERVDRFIYQSSPDYTDNAYYLFKHSLITRAGVTHVWLLHDISLSEFIEADFNRWSGDRGNRLKIIRRRSISGYWQFLRGGYVFHTHGIYPFVRYSFRRRVINLWHGMPIKAIGALNTITPNPHPTFGTDHVATSPLFRYVIAQAFRAEAARVMHTLLPRCDAFRPGCVDQNLADLIKKELELSCEHIVAWLPTYREVLNSSRKESFLSDIEPSILTNIDEQAGLVRCNVIVKLHPYDPLNFNLPSWPYRHIKLVSAQEWQTLGIQLYDFLAITAGLLTDVSSVIFDYQVTDRPIGIIGFNQERYLRDLVFPMDWITNCPRYQLIRKSSDIENFFRSAVQRPIEVPKHDYSSFFVTVFSECGSESILRQLGR